jgi:sodium/potassium-transporting ATPase subunit alpha|mmetsp:Transcript_21574/g.28880  ORF Transcript_21574/g.28880 Transcript_21574/m.28880 type:complete len:604 (+) Transcript_21574:1979-3790(+)
MKYNVEAANDRFGLMGERVLAFAKTELEPSQFPKNYAFNTPNWQSFGDDKPELIDYRYQPGNKEGWFPMWGLTLVGLVSLNDPPRPKVDTSVKKCRAAGVKVIMVTGDQPPTAAAIAHKVNIIEKPELEYNKLVVETNADGSLKYTNEQAFEKCTSIVIHGDKLAEVINAEEALDDDEPEKGRIIMDWIRKPEVVFARTTPSQKLQIVHACQKLGHIVAVTGDGVNDSPAIKQADIGIAMGSGSEVAQNAADMLLLDDNFSSIVNGVEEGRLIFDNLKKSIAYTLSSNIPEISPFLFFMMFQIPQPLSTVLILCIDLGTDMVPAISFAYENPELDIMERYPRNSQRDHLVNSKLISFAYLQIGVVQAGAGFFTYFYIMNDYGFKPGVLFGLAAEDGWKPKETDAYDPTAANLGNTNKGNSEFGPVKLDMITNRNSAVDVRLFFTDRKPEEWAPCRWSVDDDVPHFYKYSHVSDNQICHTVEALFYSQCGYLVSIVCVQWSDLLICKTRNLSISQQGMINNNSNFALFFETSLVAILCYVWPLNLALGTRMIAFPHFAVPTVSFFMVIIFYDETRKVFLRQGMKYSSLDKRIKFEGWVVRNTYY